MSKTDRDINIEEDIIEQMEEEIEEIKNEEWSIDEEKLNEANPQVDENSLLAKIQADFDNYKKRVERDKDDMIFFLKSDIIKKILPRIDDLERILKNTPEDMKSNPLYEWLESTLKKLEDDLSRLWIKSYNCIWEEVDPALHEVITAIPWEKDDIVVDEFEKWYKLWDKVLRYAKVIASKKD